MTRESKNARMKEIGDRSNIALRYFYLLCEGHTEVFLSSAKLTRNSKE